MLLLLLSLLLDVGQLLDTLLLYFWPVLTVVKQGKTKMKQEQAAWPLTYPVKLLGVVRETLTDRLKYI